MDVRKIGAYLSELRKQKNYTQAELAQMLEISHQAVSKWERGESMPDIGLLQPTAKLLGVSVDELLTGEPLASDPLAAEPQTEQVADPSEQADRRISYEQVRRLAPFLSQDTLDSLMDRLEGEVDWDTIKAFAPFLGRTRLSKLVDQAAPGLIDVSSIVGIAPFLGQETLDRLFMQGDWESMRSEEIVGLAPFLSREALTELVAVKGDSIDFGVIMRLAPFLGQSSLNRLIEKRGPGRKMS